MARAKYFVVWSADADNDLVEVWQFLVTEESPRVAIGKVREIARACDMLETRPLLVGRSRDKLCPGMRSLLVRPYVIFYRIAGRTVEIVRVLHGRRDIDEHLFE